MQREAGVSGNAAGTVVGGLVCGAEQLPFSSLRGSVSVLRAGWGKGKVLHQSRAEQIVVGASLGSQAVAAQQRQPLLPSVSRHLIIITAFSDFQEPGVRGKLPLGPHPNLSTSSSVSSPSHAKQAP